MDLERLLNDEQLKPVLDTDGAVLVLAGAGSGKTRVLTYRVAHLIKSGVPAYAILAITFTNKAAREMSERIFEVTQSREVTVCTFHSFCARILRREADKLKGYNSNFSIYSETDRARTVSEILKQKNIDVKTWKDNCIRHIDIAKTAGLSPDEYNAGLSASKNEIIYDVFCAYESTLKKSNAMDFDDLLIKVVELFQNNPDVLAYYQKKYRYIHIDEFQDTNAIQIKIADYLACGSGNLFAVGDDDQCIYTWRGADSANILSFKKRYPNCRVYKLERNYRSTKKILAVANKVINNNSRRMGKTLWTENEDGENIIYKYATDDRAEAEYIVSEIERLKRKTECNLSDFAVLVRVNSITRAIEDSLTLHGIPYRLYGGFKFYDRKEIKDILAYLRIAVNPQDAEAFTRVINFPKRGIGESTLDKFNDFCIMHGIDFLDGLLEIEKATEISQGARIKLIAFRELVFDIIKEAEVLNAIDFVKYVIEKANIYSAFDKTNDDDRGKIENIGEFVAAILEFNKDNLELQAKDYLEQVALLTSSDVSEDADGVIVATIHGVKGLEFKTVFIAGLEEGIFPSARATSENLDTEEERRTMYVAITRAKERLYLSGASTRFRFGNIERNAISRFVTETGIVLKQTKKPRGEFDDHRPSAYKPNKNTLLGNFSAVNTNNLTNDKDISVFVVGAKVMHKRFGEGEITKINGDNAEIYFHEHGDKQFNLFLAPIDIKG